MEKNMISIINEKFMNGECEKRFKHSDFAEYTKELCMKETERGEFQTEDLLDWDETEDDLVVDNPIIPLVGMMWVLLKADEENHDIDIMNDSFSIVREEYDLFDLACIYGMCYAKKYTNDGLLKVAKKEVDEVTLCYMDAIYFLITERHFMQNPYTISDLSESIIKMLKKYRIESDIEIIVLDIDMNRIAIEDNVIYALGKDNPDRDTVVRLYSLLYKVAAINYDSFMKYAELDKPLPKFVMIYLYSILNSIIKESTGKRCKALLHGDVHNLSEDELSSIEKLIDEKLSHSTIRVVNDMINEFIK